MTAARDLTAQDALAELAPFIGSQPGPKVTLPARLGPVTFEYCDSSCKAMPLQNIDPRFGVFLLRLGQFLNSAYGITNIRHLGAYPGGYGQPSHNNGIAIDIAAFVDSTGLVYSILNDWGMKPKNTSGYRLSPKDKGYYLFKDVYDFTSREGDDKYGGAHSDIGAEDSFIRHPDLHDPKAAALHKNHFHLQAGQKIQAPSGPAPVTGGGASTPKGPEAAAASSPRGFIGFLVLAGIVGGVAYYGQKKSPPNKNPDTPPKQEGEG